MFESNKDVVDLGHSETVYVLGGYQEPSAAPANVPVTPIEGLRAGEPVLRHGERPEVAAERLQRLGDFRGRLLQVVIEGNRRARKGNGKNPVVTGEIDGRQYSHAGHYLRAARAKLENFDESEIERYERLGDDVVATMGGWDAFLKKFLDSSTWRDESVAAEFNAEYCKPLRALFTREEVGNFYHVCNRINTQMHQLVREGADSDKPQVRQALAERIVELHEMSKRLARVSKKFTWTWGLQNLPVLGHWEVSDVPTVMEYMDIVSFCGGANLRGERWKKGGEEYPPNAAKDVVYNGSTLEVYGPFDRNDMLDLSGGALPIVVQDYERDGAKMRRRFNPSGVLNYNYNMERD